LNPKGKAVIFSAPSGAGKTTIVRALLNHGLPLEFSVSACSREPRERERHGKDYYFMTAEAFKLEIEKGSFVEWEEVYPGQFYGTLKSEIERVWASDKAVIFDVDVHGGLSIKKILGDNALAIFVEPPSVQVLETRLRGRSTETEHKIRVRMKKAQTELQLKSRFDHVLLNDDLGKAIAEAQKIIEEFFRQK
jgi:guanylate kinase